MSKRLFSVVCGLLAVGAVFGARPATAQQAVNFRLDFRLSGYHLPFYWAKAKGYYDQAGLAVTIKEGSGSGQTVNLVSAKEADIGLADFMLMANGISKGMQIKGVYGLLQKNPWAVISYQDAPIKTPKDIEGKSIAVSVGETGTTYLSTFAAQNGVDFNKIKRVQVDAQSRVAYFLQKQVDLVTVYRSNDLPALEEKVGTNFPMIDMAQYGLTIPGLAIVSSDAIIAKKGDVLKRFLAAVDKGITTTRGDTKGASEILLKSWPAGPSLKVVEGQVKATIDAIVKEPNHPAGWTDEKLINATLTLLKSDEDIGTPKPTKNFYTNDLLPK